MGSVGTVKDQNTINKNKTNLTQQAANIILQIQNELTKLQSLKDQTSVQEQSGKQSQKKEAEVENVGSSNVNVNELLPSSRDLGVIAECWNLGDNEQAKKYYESVS